MRRGLGTAIALLVLGLGIGSYGLARATSTTVQCDGQTMGPGDQCEHTGVSNGNPYNFTNSYQDELNAKHRVGWVVLGLGAAVVLGGGYLLYRNTVGLALVRRRLTRGRSQLAARRGWRYVPEQPGALNAWQDGVLGRRAGATAWHMLSGVANGREFAVFDYDRPSAPRRATACVVRLPFDAPEARVIVTKEKTLLLYPSLRGPRRAAPTGNAEFDGRYTIVTAAPDAARPMFTDEVIAHILAHRLTFALDRQWLIMIGHGGRADRDPASLDVRVDAATRTAALMSGAVDPTAGSATPRQ